MTSLSEPLTLPCGAVLKNRLAKAAMTEQIADSDQLPNQRHLRLYHRWSAGGPGLLITGNVQVDAQHLEHAGNMVIVGPQDAARMSAFRAFAEAAQQNGARAIMQLSHAGRQTPKMVNASPLAPSAIKLRVPGGFFGRPRAMTEADIDQVVERFAFAAQVAAEAGFAGVQIHGAHGYLLSSFLNPLANQRRDAYGGSLENRARLLLQIVDQIRHHAPEGFIVSVKLNSSDFQKGGFSTEDSLTVVDWLTARNVDLLEISGGSYEQPAMMNIEGLEKRHEENKRQSTRQREAYFLEFADAVRDRTSVPLMVTGGFRTRAGMERALAGGACDVIGLARPLCLQPELPARLLAGAVDGVPSYEKRLRVGPGVFGPFSPFTLVKAVNGFASMAFFYANIRRLADGLEPAERMNLVMTLVEDQRLGAQKAKALRRKPDDAPSGRGASDDHPPSEHGAPGDIGRG